jgi:MFS family permease
VAQDIDHHGMASTKEAGTPFLITLVALTFAMNLVARGVPETFAVFLLPVQKGLGVSRAEITLTYSVYMLAYGLSGPLAGQLIDRFGARLSYAFGLASLGIGYVLAGLSTELWHYMVTVGLLGGNGAPTHGIYDPTPLRSPW